VLDIALSVVAGTKIMQLHARGEPVPEGWLIGTDGLPTSDGSVLTAGGALVPIGGHKGYGLAILVEAMAGVLAEAAITKQCVTYVTDPDRPGGMGHWVSVWHVDAFTSYDDFGRRLARLREEIHAAPRAINVDRIFLPGEPEVEHEARSRVNGLELPEDIWRRLVALATEMRLEDQLLRSQR
jgi:LDH2 family malate/lactate/ureidoglycolate dehydrogenase